VAEFRSAQVGLSQVAIREIGSRQIAFFQVRAREIRSGKVGPLAAGIAFVEFLMRIQNVL
jgi:hypothetical protein